MMRLLCIFALIAALFVPALAAAQDQRSKSGPSQPALPNQDSSQPIQIDAATLEVHDKLKTATFSGDVQVVQGDTTMKCQKLVVYYDQEVGISHGSGPSDAKSPPGAQNVRRIEARGGVTVLTKDQTATGDLGDYDVKSKTITLTGNVVVSQGQNVIHGERVVVDTQTGNARVEAQHSGGGTTPSRVRALIQPSKGQNGEGAGTGNFMTIGPGRAN